MTQAEIKTVGEITSDMQMTPPIQQKARRNKKEPLDESERGG